MNTLLWTIFLWMMEMVGVWMLLVAAVVIAFRFCCRETPKPKRHEPSGDEGYGQQ